MSTCGFCGAEKPHSELTRFGTVTITDGRPEVNGPTFSVCGGCQVRPIAELAELLEVMKDAEQVRAQFGPFPR